MFYENFKERLGRLKPALFFALVIFTPRLLGAEHQEIPPDANPLLVPLAIIFSAIIGAFVAIIVVAKHRIIAQKQAAINFLLLQSTDGDYKADEQIFRELSGNETLTKILDAKTSSDLKEKVSIQNYLNSFELLAVSIQRHVFDENVCKSIIGDSLVKRWDEALPLINEIREQSEDDQFFEHFGELADRWRKNPAVEDPGAFKQLFQEIISFR